MENWRNSQIHLDLLATFSMPHPLDLRPDDRNWERLLGEPLADAVRRFIEENLIVKIQDVQAALPWGLISLGEKRLLELAAQRGLGAGDTSEEIVKRLIESQDALLYVEFPDVWELTEEGRKLAAPGLERAWRKITQAKIILPGADFDLAEWLHRYWKWLLILVGEGLAYDLLKERIFPIVGETALKVWEALRALPAEGGEFPGKGAPPPKPPFSPNTETSTPKPEQPEPEATKTPKPEVQKIPARRTGRYIEPEMVPIPAGYFWMGSKENDPDAYENEQPQHRLYLPAYWIGRYPVTNREYRYFILDTGRKPPYGWQGQEYPDGKADHPVVHVSWYDALAYCQWLAGLTGKAYTLPSEAEWEKAARGPHGWIYPWGDFWDASRCNNRESGIGDTTPVGKYSPRGDSYFDCADMAGNVWEWTRSLWGKDWREPDFRYPYQPGVEREDLSAGADVRRVQRGGSFLDLRGGARCACRWNVPDRGGDSFGFRVVVSPA